MDNCIFREKYLALNAYIRKDHLRSINFYLNKMVKEEKNFKRERIK